MNNVYHIFVFFLLLHSASASFDFYMLAQTWPATFCKDQNPPCGIKPPPSFTLHGLWPQNTTGPQPSKCLSSYPLKFDKEVEIALQSNWRSLKGKGQNKGFWTHEWVDQGTCSMLPPSDYFNLAIALKQMNSIAIILRVNGNAPDAKKTRTPKEIVNAIKMHTENKEPQLVCDASNKFLLEFLVHKNSKRPVQLELTRIITMIRSQGIELKRIDYFAERLRKDKKEYQRNLSFKNFPFTIE
ncbi:hypothetical protein TSUD_269730 [Trifolium subterraneum]|uniref:Uncharacterized protein n=1 Tax=Trifolium subterraneum TaxID=3900 RepID=A0A2Z6MZC9_TRISU|nr:hypothetical protein TSUD_269730 [Trifolium subterraneum]